jgi:glucose-1-phosphate adenylyltransferase
MDFGPMIRQHRETGAAVTLAAKPYPASRTSGFGIMEIDSSRRVHGFLEKPKDEEQLPGYELPLEFREPDDEEKLYPASMGIYVFRWDVLREFLEGTEYPDFGRHVLPAAVKDTHVSAFLFRGYWEDIGTMRAFYEANLALASVNPPFVFHTLGAPIYTSPRFLGATRVEDCQVNSSMITDGCYIHGSEISESVIGVRTVIQPGARITRTVIMGADGYEGDLPRPPGDPLLGIGRDCNIEGALIDKNARIGDGVTITPKEPGTEEDHPYYYVRDGVVVIPKNYAVPPGATI